MSSIHANGGINSLFSCSRVILSLTLVRFTVAADEMLRIQYLAQLQVDEVEMDFLLAQFIRLRRRRRQRRGRQRRRHWVREWLLRRQELGQYHRLMPELRAEDPTSFVNFLRVPPEMFDELLTRVGPRITKQDTFYRKSLEPGMKLAITLRHLASGDKYASLKFDFRVAHNTISLLVSLPGHRE